jgi:hypothetical protein
MMDEAEMWWPDDSDQVVASSSKAPQASASGSGSGPGPGPTYNPSFFDQDQQGYEDEFDQDMM